MFYSLDWILYLYPIALRFKLGKKWKRIVPNVPLTNKYYFKIVNYKKGPKESDSKTKLR